jgi:hypothetical protein
MRYIRISVRHSPLHGVGGFAEEFIPKGILFDIENPAIQGFHGFNWSKNPNAVPTAIRGPDREVAGEIFDVWGNMAIHDIQPSEEITFPCYNDVKRVTRNYRMALDRAELYNIPVRKMY